MRRTAVVVDVYAVRLDTHIVRSEREAVEKRPGCDACRAVGAVKEHAQRRKLRNRGGQMVQILRKIVSAVRYPAQRVMRLDGQLAVLQDEPLNFFFQRVIQLEALAGEHFDAVVLKRVVRRGDHHARVGVQHDRQIRHARRGNHAKHRHVTAAGRQTSDERTLEHVG